MKLKAITMGVLLAACGPSSFALSVRTYTAQFSPVAGTGSDYELLGFGRTSTSSAGTERMAFSELTLLPGEEYFYDKWNLDVSLMAPGDYAFSSWVIPATGTLKFTSFVMHSYKAGDLQDVLFDVGDGLQATGSGSFTVEKPCGVNVCVWFEIHGTQMVGQPAGYAPNTPLVAMPEPETYALMLAGLGAVGFMARRRKLQAA